MYETARQNYVKLYHDNIEASYLALSAIHISPTPRAFFARARALPLWVCFFRRVYDIRRIDRVGVGICIRHSVCNVLSSAGVNLFHYTHNVGPC